VIKIKLYGEEFVMGEDFVWSGEDKSTASFLTKESKLVMRGYGPANGWPRPYVLHKIVDLTGADVLEEEEYHNDPNVTY